MLFESSLQRIEINNLAVAETERNWMNQIFFEENPPESCEPGEQYIHLL